MDLDGYVSGPLTDKLGIRVAGYHNTMKGWLYNPNPAATNHRLEIAKITARASR